MRLFASQANDVVEHARWGVPLLALRTKRGEMLWLMLELHECNPFHSRALHAGKWPSSTPTETLRALRNVGVFFVGVPPPPGPDVVSRREEVAAAAEEVGGGGAPPTTTTTTTTTSTTTQRTSRFVVVDARRVLGPVRMFCPRPNDEYAPYAPGWDQPVWVAMQRHAGEATS